MPRAFLLLGLLAARCCLGADAPAPREAPNYSAASIVNAADNLSNALAPNTIGTIYGTNLAYSTAGLTPCDVPVCYLPTQLGSQEASVIINYSFSAALFYVSPTQINFLVPPLSSLQPGPASIYVDVDGLVGPIIELTLATTAPGLFQLPSGTCQPPQGPALQCAVATLVDGTVLTPKSPANPGDIVVLYATGLGATVLLPPANYLQIPTVAASLVPGANLQILLDGVAVASSAILYAGIAPDNAGLYQITLTLPMSTGAYPQIQLVMGQASSISGVHLPVS
jgi:uncharacterized protein (TIGR03437 family)